MQYLLEGFVADIRQAMERAVEDDNDVNQWEIDFGIEFELVLSF